MNSITYSLIQSDILHAKRLFPQSMKRRGSKVRRQVTRNIKAMPWNCKQAIEEAKKRAKQEKYAQTVWRCNDRFAVVPAAMPWPDTLTADNHGQYKYSVRPVVTYNPDGTEYA